MEEQQYIIHELEKALAQGWSTKKEQQSIIDELEQIEKFLAQEKAFAQEKALAQEQKPAIGGQEKQTLSQEPFVDYVARHAANHPDPSIMKLIAHYYGAGGLRTLKMTLGTFLMKFMSHDILNDFSHAYPDKIPYTEPVEQYIPTKKERKEQTVVHGFLLNMNMQIAAVYPDYISKGYSTGKLTLKAKYKLKEFTLTIRILRDGKPIMTLIGVGSKECMYICNLAAVRMLDDDE